LTKNSKKERQYDDNTTYAKERKDAEDC
jgi:hypothetical protein